MVIAFFAFIAKTIAQEEENNHTKSRTRPKTAGQGRGGEQGGGEEGEQGG